MTGQRSWVSASAKPKARRVNPTVGSINKMKTAKDILNDIADSLYKNVLNRYLVLGQIVLLCAAVLVWIKIITAQNIFIYSSTNYFPIQVYIVVMAIHLILSVYSYKNDKYISGLLLGASILYVVLILILELLYIIYR